MVRSLVGHGVGRWMHEDPQVPNYGRPGKGPLLEEGMVLAIEPMTTAGRPAVRVGGDGWAMFSQDESPAAHFEFTVAITAEGPRVLTPWHLAEGAASQSNGRAAGAAARASRSERKRMHRRSGGSGGCPAHAKIPGRRTSTGSGSRPAAEPGPGTQRRKGS